MASFDLVDCPWLPCVRPDGSAAELSLRQALVDAHELRELFDPSPLVTVALHRLLLAVLHRAYMGPATMSAWREIWNAGRFDAARINSYLDHWRHRFDLFDPDRPFYQVPFIADLGDPKTGSSVARLAHELATGSNATLFDHTMDSAPEAVPAAQAARVLVAAQGFALAGGVSKPFNFSHGPMVAGYSLLATGDSLFENLTLNLVLYNRYRPVEWLGEHEGPRWEQDADATPAQGGTPVAGYTDYLTWQSRRIHLILDGEGGTITRCLILQNLTVQASLVDPFKSYVASRTKGWVEQKFAPDRALWRDSTPIFRQLGNADSSGVRGRPKIIDWMGEVDDERRRGRIQAERTYRLRAYGLTTAERKAGSVVLWRREELPLPLELLNEPEAIARVSDAVEVAERVGRVLWNHTRRLANLLLAPTSDEIEGRKPEEKDVLSLIRALGVEERFWPRLEAPFAKFLAVLPDDRTVITDDGEEEFVFGKNTLPEWVAEVRGAARQAFSDSTVGLDRSARALKAVAVARGAFERHLANELRPWMGGDEKGAAA